MKKQITTKIEKQLASLVSDDRTKLVATLLKQAALHCRTYNQLHKLEVESDFKFETAKEALSQVKKIEFLRTQKEAKNFGLSVAEFKRLQKKARLILRDFNTGYSMGDGKNLYIKGKKGSFAFRDDTQEYAKSCRYSATHGQVSITLSLTDLRELEQIQGVWTRRFKNNQVKFLDNSGKKWNHKVVYLDGFLFGDSHAMTSKEARNLDRRNRIEKAKAERREQLDAITRELAENVFIGWDDIRKTSCEAASNKFVKTHGLEKDFGYNVQFLQSIADENQKRFIQNAANIKARSLVK